MTYSNTVIVTIAIVIFLFIFALLLIWVAWPKQTNTTPPPTTLLTVSGFNQSCSTLIPCATGLTCQGGICKRDLGGSCTTLNDCTTAANACVNGVCSVIQTSGLNGPAPCGTGLAPNNNNICKGLVNFPCTINSDCLSGTCNGGACTSLAQAGQACSSNDNCASNLYCSLNYCQQIGNTTGQLGATCNFPAPPCNSGLQCVTNVCIVDQNPNAVEKVEHNISKILDNLEKREKLLTDLEVKTRRVEELEREVAKDNNNSSRNRLNNNNNNKLNQNNNGNKTKLSQNNNKLNQNNINGINNNNMDIPPPTRTEIQYTLDNNGKYTIKKYNSNHYWTDLHIDLEHEINSFIKYDGLFYILTNSSEIYVCQHNQTYLVYSDNECLTDLKVTLNNEIIVKKNNQYFRMEVEEDGTLTMKLIYHSNKFNDLTFSDQHLTFNDTKLVGIYNYNLTCVDRSNEIYMICNR